MVKRFDVKGILKDPILRKEINIGVIIFLHESSISYLEAETAYLNSLSKKVLDKDKKIVQNVP